MCVCMNISKFLAFKKVFTLVYSLDYLHSLELIKDAQALSQKPREGFQGKELNKGV